MYSDASPGTPFVQNHIVNTNIVSADDTEYLSWPKCPSCLHLADLTTAGHAACLACDLSLLP